MILLLGSCANDITQSGTDTNGERNTLKLAFNIEQPRIVTDGNVMKTTRSMTTAQESVVNSISIVVFNTSGDKVGECYSTFSSAKNTTFYASVPVAVANSYMVYAVANASSAAIASMKAATTLTAFNAISETLSSADDLNSATSLAMFGKGTATLGNSNGVGSTTSISLSRLAAKITLNLTSSNNFTITGYQICSTTMSSYVSSDNLATTNISGTTFNVANTFNDQTEVSGLSIQNASTSANIFMYENMAGTNSASKTPALRISLNSPKKATYLVVYATSSSSVKCKFTYYLGGSSSSDFTGFDISRNTNYIYNINISGTDLADMRVLCPGEFLFSDGTWGGISYNSSKTPIAIVFAINATSDHKNNGYTNGEAMALTNASTNCSDGNNSSSIAKSYSVTAPLNTSGWYLPSIFEFRRVISYLGGLSATETEIVTPNIGGIWFSTTAAPAVVSTLNSAFSKCGVAYSAFGYNPSQDFWTSTSSGEALHPFLNVNFYYNGILDADFNNGNSENNTLYVRSVIAF